MLAYFKFKYFQLLAVISFALISATTVEPTGNNRRTPPLHLICARQLQVWNRLRNTLSSLLTGIPN